jgi:hypothetical protein
MPHGYLALDSSEEKSAGIDGIYCHNGNIYLLQMTVSLKHPPLNFGEIWPYVGGWKKDDGVPFFW